MASLGFPMLKQFVTGVSGRIAALDARKSVETPYKQELTFVALVGISAYFYLAILTFSPQDPTPFSASFPAAKIVSNGGGTIGAELASSSYFWLGALSLLLPLPILEIAFRAIARQGQLRLLSRLIGWTIFGVVLLIAGKMLEAWFPNPSGTFPISGALGSLMAGKLVPMIGKYGTLLALGTALLSAALILTRTSLIRRGSNHIAQLLSSKSGSSPLPAGQIAVEELSSRPFSLEDHGIEDRNLTFVPDAQMQETPESKIVHESFANIPQIHDPAQEDDCFSMNSFVPSLPRADYRPSAVMFRCADKTTADRSNDEEQVKVAESLVRTLQEFGIEGKIVGFQKGPVVSVYEFRPDAGVKQSKVLTLIDDLALSLKVESIFIFPVPEKKALGIQVPHESREQVLLGDLVACDEFQKTQSPLLYAMGKGISGKPVLADLKAMPHLLIAGATGAGKSVGINTLLCSLLLKASPDQVKLILVDPKMLELSVYEGVPHLLMPVITEPDRASVALKWAINEMERRYLVLKTASVRNIDGFNSRWQQFSNSERERFRQEVGDPDLSEMPYIVIVIDELADLMLTAPKDVEGSIQRLAQKARASGIHMVLATQRPSVDVITGVIKANLPCRMSFQVVSKHDSRTILDQMGSEKLLGKGDLLFQRPGVSRLERVQGAFVSDQEVLTFVEQLKALKANYDDAVINWIDEENARQKSNGASLDDAEGGFDDAKFTEAMEIASRQGFISASYLQRQLKVGYNRAARMVEEMEKRHLVEKADGAKPRRWCGPNLT